VGLSQNMGRGGQHFFWGKQPINCAHFSLSAEARATSFYSGFKTLTYIN
jgi:hypothetical protein